MAKTKTEKKEAAEKFALPEGRAININVFERDIYTDPDTGAEGKPFYKIELAFDPSNVEGEGTIEDKLIDACCDEWGDGAEQDFLDGKISTPFLSGDDLAADREDKGKVGDAYKGKTVIRLGTLYNANGQEGPGGIQVYDDGSSGEVQRIEIVNQDQVFNGCYGIAGVTIKAGIKPGTKKRGYEGDRYVKFWLQAFQVTRADKDDRLSSGGDHSSLFKPVGRKADGGTSRRRRAG